MSLLLFSESTCKTFIHFLCLFKKTFISFIYHLYFTFVSLFIYLWFYVDFKIWGRVGKGLVCWLFLPGLQDTAFKQGVSGGPWGTEADTGAPQLLQPAAFPLLLGRVQGGKPRQGLKNSLNCRSGAGSRGRPRRPGFTGQGLERGAQRQQRPAEGPAGGQLLLGGAASQVLKETPGKD